MRSGNFGEHRVVSIRQLTGDDGDGGIRMGHLSAERGEPVRPSTGKRTGRFRNELQPMLDVKDVAELLGTPERFVRRLIAERRIGYTKVGRYVRFSPADVRAFIEAGRMDPAGPWDLVRSHGRVV